MHTVCPKCGLMLVVTTADLRAAHGHVRCGRCRGVFNALEYLVEPTPETSAPTGSESSPEPQSAPPEPTPPDESVEDTGPALETESTPEAWVEPDAATQDSADIDDSAETESVESQSATPEPVPSPEPAETTPPAPESEMAAAVWVATQASEQVDETIETELSAPLPETQTADTLSPAPEFFHEPELRALPETGESHAPGDFEFEPTNEHRSRGWWAGVLVLALLLAGQVVNHYRGTLATMPSVGATVRAVYGALGIPIVPLWNVRAYRARQLGATVRGSNPHQISVRASIVNRGSWPLPLPLLRVTLQDRYGRTIATRDVPPRDYLPPSAPSTAMLPPGRRIDATVAFVNPGPQAVGFEIDACLRESATVVCAHGPR